MKCLIEAGPAKFNIHTASVWLLLRNQEVLILTALRHPPFKGRDGKMNLRQERGVSEQLLLEFLGSLPMHTILPRFLPPDLSRQSYILKNEWQDEKTSNSNLIETFFQVQTKLFFFTVLSGCRVCCQGNCSVLLTYCNVQKSVSFKWMCDVCQFSEERKISCCPLSSWLLPSSSSLGLSEQDKGPAGKCISVWKNASQFERRLKEMALGSGKGFSLLDWMFSPKLPLVPPREKQWTNVSCRLFGSFGH